MVKKIIGQCYIWLILILMYLPILVLIAFSFTNSVNVGIWKGFSFELYGNLFRSKETMVALANTLIIAITSAIVSTILGTLGAVGAFYASKKFRKAFEFVNQIPVVNAEIVMALSLAIMFAALPSLLFKTDLRSYWTLLNHIKPYGKSHYQKSFLVSSLASYLRLHYHLMTLSSPSSQPVQAY